MISEKENPRIGAYFEKYFKWSIASMCKMDGDIPIVRGSHSIPKCLVPFPKIRQKYWNGAYVHFFNNDYEFDGEHGIWLDTTRHIPYLERYKGVISPDFSLYGEAGQIPLLWNTYRNRLVECHLERLGFDVIPCVSWAMPNSYDFCFSGIPQNSVVAVSTIGIMQSKDKRQVFEDGYREMCRRLSPEFVVLYGSDNGLDLGTTPYRQFRNATYNWTSSFSMTRKAV